MGWRSSKAQNAKLKLDGEDHYEILRNRRAVVAGEFARCLFDFKLSDGCKRRPGSADVFEIEGLLNERRIDGTGLKVTNIGDELAIFCAGTRLLDGEDHYEILSNQVRLMNERSPPFVEFAIHEGRYPSFPSASCRVKVVGYRLDSDPRRENPVKVAEAGSQNGFSEAARKCLISKLSIASVQRRINGIKSWKVCWIRGKKVIICGVIKASNAYAEMALGARTELEDQSTSNESERQSAMPVDKYPFIKRHKRSVLSRYDSFADWSLPDKNFAEDLDVPDEREHEIIEGIWGDIWLKHWYTRTALVFSPRNLLVLA
ncbi:hypothetical protein SCHPADRAFT_926713 [Schizopora paradoxa]|uniref:Uncharacterized protein n=1 Tax=Schizopora paradoxa TaxID=27342 RepID=A0A0H2RX66_9AGAM|nr:hypothetical protein SCHPADRAFT_926713 [Schizopora paradoxa]